MSEKTEPKRIQRRRTKGVRVETSERAALEWIEMTSTRVPTTPVWGALSRAARTSYDAMVATTRRRARGDDGHEEDS